MGRENARGEHVQLRKMKFFFSRGGFLKALGVREKGD